MTSAGSNNNGGTIIIEKQTLPDGSAQNFDFTGDIVASLTDGDISTPLTVPAGTYTVTETAVTGWSVASIICDDTDSTGDIGSATATFTVAVGETITCVFTNSQTATLTLNKIVNNTAGSATPDLWTLDASLAGTSVLNGTNGVSADDLVAGDYVLSESAGPAGYTFVDLVCDDGALNAATNTLTLESGDNATCTFTNRDLLTDLQITKTVSNFNPIVGEVITFELTVTNNGPDDATNVVVNDTVLNGFTFQALSMLGGDSRNQTAPNLEWIINSLPAGAANAVVLNYQATVVAP